MDYEAMKKMAEKIVMSTEMKRRILEKCQSRVEKSRKEQAVQNNRRGLCVRKPAVAIAIMMSVICLAATAVAVTGLLQGYFVDIKDERGAVIGTSYEQADEEVIVSVRVDGKALLVSVEAVNPRMAPYSEAGELSIGAYQIVRTDGTVAKEWSVSDSASMVDGRAEIRITLADVEAGDYELVVRELVAAKKADQPLAIKGNWACPFSK